MADQTPVGLPKPDWFPPKPYQFHELIPHLESIVESMPTGHVYPRAAKIKDNEEGCAYWHAREGQPGCIIGRLMARLGASGEFLAACDDVPNGSGLDTLISAGILAGLFEKRAAWALRHLQALQDGGVPWSQAVEQARSYWAGIRDAERDLARAAIAAQFPLAP